MLDQSKLLILTVLLGLFSFQLALAGSYPTSSAAVQVTASVETPLGFKIIKESEALNDTEQLLVQYPSIGGVQLLVEIDGILIDHIILKQPIGLPSDPAFQRMNADQLRLTSVDKGSSCLVTLISISQ